MNFIDSMKNESTMHKTNSDMKLVAERH